MRGVCACVCVTIFVCACVCVCPSCHLWVSSFWTNGPLIHLILHLHRLLRWWDSNELKLKNVKKKKENCYLSNRRIFLQLDIEFCSKFFPFLSFFSLFFFFFFVVVLPGVSRCWMGLFPPRRARCWFPLDVRNNIWDPGQRSKDRACSHYWSEKSAMVWWSLQ